ncbi:MAG TPA: transcription-repair coupling factor [Xanthobacteraceae bacterium]|nr:transcription-repair coupling factor [Xanthobacteraceae bacterium]
MNKPFAPADRLVPGKVLTIASVPDGFSGLVAADLAKSVAARAKTESKRLLVVCRDAERMAAFERALSFFAPDLSVLTFPAWDCLPYDRVSPNAAVAARRMATLANLARSPDGSGLVLTTINALLQRVIARAAVAAQSLALAAGNVRPMDEVARWLETNGFIRASTVRDIGEYAVRGGILDLYAPGTSAPVRLDFFGDTLESLRAFDPETQRTASRLDRLELVPTSEVRLEPDTIKRFRMGYVAEFGGQTKGDAFFEAVSQGRRHPGLEHWLPLFAEKLETLFDYLPGTPVVLEPLIEEAAHERLAQIADYYGARREAMEAGQSPLYKPLPPERLYLAEEEWKARLAAAALARLTPFAMPATPGVIDAGGKAGRTFATERADENKNLFDAVAAHARALEAANKRVLFAFWSEGSRERMQHVLIDHGLANLRPVANFSEALTLSKGAFGLAILGLESGFESADAAIISEQDILGDRLARPRRRQRRADDFVTELTSLSAGDLVVHIDHGIGRFAGLKTIEALGAPHDCLEIHYQGGDRLFLPVENLELLSRYGNEEAHAELDRLGGLGWQTRKARLKTRIREMAAELVRVAAARKLREAPKLTVPEGLYDEFCARFPYEETDDQDGAIDAVTGDLAAGRPMDRLVCGDVGFGKTEVALRAAFITALSGKQVAVVVPTTLLARQHFLTFSERFRGFPVRVAQASRLVSSGELAKVREELAAGSVDIVIGTHALLAKSVKFKDLGLVVVDEEQHFGVAHKERLKQLRNEVHVLTLTATPIPRTLSLALAGVRELSIIATPPVDRLAVRTFITPFDPLVVREALLRERYRGGQAFYVCPRIEDIAGIREFLEHNVPEVKFAVAHGQMPARELEDIMGAFYEGKFDVLVSTTIIESGLDIPTANTLVVHRADRFGLAQLYQLRGRVGRSKTRAYAIFTMPAEKPVTAQAERRLKVLQSLDSLGAGFELASHDLDIRGAGNLLGEEQSGHIREVGYELYQEMLAEAVAALEAGIEQPAADKWSPQIAAGIPVFIPEDYVPDLGVRLGLYRRLADLENDAEIEAAGAELVDRFGKLPPEVETLLKVVAIKALCRRANVERIEAGPKGAVITFRDNKFNNAEGLLAWIAAQTPLAKIRPDQKIVWLEDWQDAKARLAGARELLENLVRIAERAKAA